MASFATEEEREEARLLFVALVARLGEHAPYTRRAVPKSDLRPESDAPEDLQRFERVLNRLTTEKLLVVRELAPEGKASAASPDNDDDDEGAFLVEVAHEALIRTWA